MRGLLGIACIALVTCARAAQLCEHNSSFVPDFVLRATLVNTSIACNDRLSVLVNGTSPGPPLHIPGGKTTWIRVYNDMQSDNLTMVCKPRSTPKATIFHVRS
jgi:hypothetical protein